MNRMRLKHVSELKYLECVLGGSGTDEEERRRKVASGRRVAGAIKPQVNTRGLQLDCAWVFHDTLFVPVLMYGSEVIICK